MSEALISRVQDAIRDVPDFPSPGIVFKDITPVLADGELFQALVRHLAERYGGEITQVVGIESRGFIFGAALAHELGVGLTLVRKPGKLPAEVVGVDYTLEYGTDRLEMHVDALKADDRVVIVDDLLATGGTAGATIQLVKESGATIVEFAFLIELAFLEGRKRLEDTEIYAMLAY